MRNTNTTIIDFYSGAYGPTLRIDIQDIEWVHLFHNALIRLKNKDIPELDLLGLKNVERGDIAGFKLLRDVDTSLSCVAPANSRGYAAFIWKVDTEKIQDLIDMIDIYIEKNKPGHHYLNDEDGVLIELAYKE